MTIRYERVTVTPKLAAEWLEKNSEANRRPKSSRIPMYARDMLTGRWNSDTGETIKFDVFGSLIDGQNRLMAIVFAGQTDPDITVSLDVSKGHPADAMRVIDSGASRTFADGLRMQEGVIDRNRVGAVVRWAIQWEVGNPTSSGKFAPTNAELWDRYRKEADLFDAATKRGQDTARQGLGLSSTAALAYYLFVGKNPVGTSADEFFDHYVSGAGLDFGSPILALRNRMGRVKLDRLRRQEQLALTIKAWNNWRDGKRVDSIILPKGALTNANFPIPK